MKTAIIIGATSGIGREVAVRLVEDGWKVGITGRRTEALEAFRSQYGVDKVFISTMDVTREDSVQALEVLLEQTGAPNLFFYASGVGDKKNAEHIPFGSGPAFPDGADPGPVHGYPARIRGYGYLEPRQALSDADDQGKGHGPHHESPETQKTRLYL